MQLHYSCTGVMSFLVHPGDSLPFDSGYCILIASGQSLSSRTNSCGGAIMLPWYSRSWTGGITTWKHTEINKLDPGRCGNIFKSKILNLIIQNSSLGILWDIAFRWIPQKPPNENSGNGLVLSGQANVDPDLHCHMASLSHKELHLSVHSP